jgi:hypothetical protein
MHEYSFDINANPAKKYIHREERRQFAVKSKINLNLYTCLLTCCALIFIPNVIPSIHSPGEKTNSPAQIFMA